MIRITKLDSNFTIYKNKKVVIWGCDTNGQRVLNLLKYFNIDVFAFCDNNPNLWGELAFDNIKTISPSELGELKDEHDVIVQIAVAGQFTLTADIVKQLEDMGCTDYITIQELINVLGFVRKTEFLESNSDFKNSHKYLFVPNNDEAEFYDCNSRARIYDFIISNRNSQVLMICSAPKTGDNTLGKTFRENNTVYINMGHRTNTLHKSILKDMNSKVKLITVLREPISQNASCMYNIIAGGSHSFRKSIFEFGFTLEEILGLNVGNFFENGGDAQILFDNFLDFTEYLKPVKTHKYSSHDAYPHIIQHFVPEFQKNLFDIMKEPFDKERGFSIVSDENTEVFVCQLEKLSGLAKELSDFSGGSFDKLINANESNGKWFAQSYKDFQKNVKLSEEYFNRCFKEPYVNHFYSDEQISKFKSKWENNVL